MTFLARAHFSSSICSPAEVPGDTEVILLSDEDSRIHGRATVAAQRFKQSEAELMEALIAVGDIELYLRLGYPSLFRYATEALGLSEAVAYSAISVARKAAKIPVLRDAVRSGELGLSKAKKILSVLDPVAPSSEQKGWVKKAVLLSSRKLEREVASENPMAAVSERVIYKSARRIELVLGLWEDVVLDFRQAQNLISNGRTGEVSLEKTLTEVLRFYLERKDPERRAKRVIAKKGIGAGAEKISEGLVVSRPVTRTPVPGEPVKVKRFTGTVHKDSAKIGTGIAMDADRVHGPGLFAREPLRSALVHQVRLRDRNSCQASMPDGKLCGSRRWLDIHHRIPVSEGGENVLENLMMLCRAHHRAHHRFTIQRRAIAAHSE